MPGRANLNKEIIESELPVPSGGTRTIRDRFSLGFGYYQMMLQIKATVVIGTGADAVADGMKRALKQVVLSTSADGISIQADGISLAHRAFRMSRIQPDFTTMAAASGVYTFNLPIFFLDRNAKNPEDTVLDTSRYKWMKMDITMGAIGDLFDTPGTATVTWDISLVASVSKGQLIENRKPSVYPYFINIPVQDPDNQNYLDVERANDLVIRHLDIFTTVDATGGVNYSGDGNNDVFSNISFKDNFRFVIQQERIDMLRSETKQIYRLEVLPAGHFTIPFAATASLFEGYITGDKSLVRIEGTIDTTSTSGFNASIDGVRSLKDIPENAG